DGGESLIPAMEFILNHSSDKGVQHLVIGMAHRGRLNVLTNILGKSFRKLFAKFLSDKEDPYALGSGDVKYHLGYSNDRMIQGKNLHLSLMSNPSHLEAVNPVVLGKVRAEQHHLGDTNREKVMGILMHGDAAFAGQGLVAETLELCDLSGYRTGGTLHIIINNQIGFTTSPPHSRSSPYSSDIAKAIQAPIFHVNSDDPEAVLRVCRVALDYRARFAHDVVIDLIFYRRYGHNESDEPSFTQPLMYKAISKHPSTATLYAQKLVQEKTLVDKDVKALYSDFGEVLDEEYRMAVDGDDCFDPPYWLKGSWQGIEASASSEEDNDAQPDTGVSKDILDAVGQQIFNTPDGIKVNSKIVRQLQAKQKMLETGEGVDWGTAEALAFGTLLHEGHHVRLSGQDCGRGTFSHRHVVLIDQESEEKYIPLDHIKKGQPLFEPVDSPLAEASVVGFEYGYSSASPHNLVLWEAQFGDFANGAQVMIDQFLAAGETKWARQNGLVLLLPHSFEGQGPEHSSARLERFLQLCAEGNWCVANCSTPANYFHILRRQLKQAYRKPLILMTPKSLLRHPKCVSSVDAFDGAFSPVYDDLRVARDGKASKTIQRVVLCSGKVYYDLLAAHEAERADHVAIIRLEQFYPWPKKDLMRILEPYKHAEFVWCQEEPENMGAWHFLDRRLENTLMAIHARQPRPRLISRPPAASPATGLLRRHEKEQKTLMDAALAPLERKILSATK
ncbi:MAG: 2-oxoglutarate dehydrogenase E1 component, partial [Alphaproteobacteria bacterium]|nr:2-oxoglutarate dehydrogenase E1 component [Alphaproteobacteria bacterium]